MERLRFNNIPRAVLNFTEAEVAILMRCSELHYDSRCKSYSKPGGFVHGLKNRLTWPDTNGKTGEVDAMFSDVDTMAKIVEFTCPGVDRHAQFSLGLELSRTLTALNEEYRRINPED